MPEKKYTYGKDNQDRAYRVFQVLLDYSDSGIEQKKITCWKKDGLLNFEISKTDLIPLVTAIHSSSDWEDDIRPVISHYLRWLGILHDNRKVTKGSSIWKFSLALWCEDTAENLRRFNDEWVKKCTDRQKKAFQAESPPKQPDREIASTQPQPQQRQLFGATQIRAIPQWVGRDELLAELHADLVQNRQVLVVYGQGGIGKTSLAVKLMEACGVDLSKSILLANCPYDNALYCQITDSDSFDTLVAKFLAAFGMPANRDGATPAQTVDKILARLHQERWLVIIDNLESLMEPDTSKTKSSEMGDFLNSLAYGGHNSQIVITSRKFPADLYDRRGTTFDRRIVRAEKLWGISTAASIDLLKDLGMQDSDDDLEWIAQQVKGNVLVLGMLAKYSEQPGQLRQEPELVTDEATPIVKKQWEKQGAAAQELLERMCVLRIGMNAVALTKLRLLQPDGGEMEFTREAQKATVGLLDGLVDCGLVETTYDKSAYENLYVQHRLIAETLQAIFEKDLKQLWQYAARLYDSFEPPTEFRSLEDWRFVLEKLYFWWKLGRYEVVTGIVTSFLLSIQLWGCLDLQREWCDRILPHTEGINYLICLGRLGFVCYATGKFQEGEDYFQLLHDRAKSEGSLREMAGSLLMLGDIASRRCDYDKAEELYSQSLEIYTELGDRIGMSAIWGSLGQLASLRGEYDKAQGFYNQLLEVSTELGNRLGMVSSISLLGNIAILRGEYDKAEELYRQSLEIHTELGNRGMMALIWGAMGSRAIRQGEYNRAEELCNQSLAVHTELGDRLGMSLVWGSLGQLASLRGEYDKAKGFYNQSLEVCTELGDRAGMAENLGILGDLARNRDDYNKAEELYNQSLKIRTELGDRAGMALMWGCLGDIACYQGNDDKARQLYHESLEVRTELGDRAGMTLLWGCLGDIARRQVDYGKAEEFYNQSLAVRTELGDRAGMALLWGCLGDIASKQGEYDKAEGLYNQSLKIRTELGDCAGMALMWSCLGYIARNRGEYDKAEGLYNQSLKIRTELGDRAGMTEDWGLLGEIARYQGDYDKAEELYDQSLKIRTELGDRAGMAENLGILGNIARYRDDYNKAEELYNQSLAVRTELGDRAGIALMWGCLGDIASKQDNDDKAEELYNQSLAVRTELGDRAGMAEIWGCLGSLASKQGEYECAEERYHQSLAVYTELGDRAGMALMWSCLGYIARNRGEYDKAEGLYNQSLEVYTELGDRAGMTEDWGLLGEIARYQGKYDKAEELYNQSLEVRTELGDRAGMAENLGILGDLARNRDDYNKAEGLYNQSLKIRTELGNRAGMAEIWGCLGENELKQGNLETAETWLKQALTVREDLQMLNGIAEINWDLAQLYRAKGDARQAQVHYSISHGLFTQLGAKKDLERIEREWIDLIQA